MVHGGQSDPLFLRIRKVLSGIAPVIILTLAEYAIHPVEEKSNDFEDWDRGIFNVTLARLKL
jgi:hypothetical protein